MTSMDQKSLRHWLQSSFTGPVALALLLGAGLNGLVQAASEPLKVLLISLIDRLIRQSRLDVIPLQPTKVAWGITTETSITPFGFVVVAIVLALWLYPKSRSDF